LPISPFEAVSATLGKKIKTWRELVLHICTLTPKGQPKITVKETRQGALKFLDAAFYVTDTVFTFEGPYYKSQTKYNDPIELIDAILEAISWLLKIHDYVIDPFYVNKIRNTI